MASSYHADDNLGAMLLSKRGCVSDCVVPSCNSIRCSASEACILSAQTCGACPAVSCVPLELTVTMQPMDTRIPKGAIAGIVIAAIVLVLAASLLFYKIRQRRRLILEINEKRMKGLPVSDLEQNEVYDDKSHRLSDVASITIGISEELAASPTALASPQLPGDHFFSADELLRMSYAESESSDSRASQQSQTRDYEAAMIQRTNSTATAMRAKIFQYSRASALGIEASTGTDNAQQNLTLTHHSESAASGPTSCWEDDQDSILDSPVERDLISKDHFEPSLPISNRPRASLKRYSSTGGRSLTRVDSDTLATPNDRQSALSRSSKGDAASASSRNRLSSRAYEWHDPSQLPGGADDN